MAEQDPVTQAAEPAPAEPAAPVPTPGGPWQADIEASFSDPQVRATVDAFLRSKIQPRMTQLEQQISATSNAKALWDAFQEDPAQAYAAITYELYGEEAAQAALNTLESQLAGRQAAAQPEPQPQPAAPATDPRLEEMYNAWQREQELKAYDAEIERITSDPANADIDPNLIHTFVAAAEGDFDEAIQRYRTFAGEFLAKYGVAPTADNTGQGAPPVMGSEAGGAGASPPVQPEYRGQDGLNRAIDDAVAAMKRNAQAPPVS